MAKVPLANNGLEAPFQAIFTAPSFALGVACSNEAITRLEFLPPAHGLTVPPHTAPPALAAEALRQLACWLDDPVYRFTLPLAPAGTPFRQRVWQAIAAIPCGQTQSYGDIARQLGSAPRAVGQACGDNPYPVIVPCHRVTAANGKLGGFNHVSEADSGNSWLPATKRWLLQRENAQICI
jgi:methylated-DNA-[protein]-cysteine S-methyltransferase